MTLEAIERKDTIEGVIKSLIRTFRKTIRMAFTGVNKRKLYGWTDYTIKTQIRDFYLSLIKPPNAPITPEFYNECENEFVYLIYSNFNKMKTKSKRHNVEKINVDAQLIDSVFNYATKSRLYGFFNIKAI